MARKKKRQELAQPIRGYPDITLATGTYLSEFGQTARESVHVSEVMRNPTPWDGKTDGRLVELPANYALNGTTYYRYREDVNYGPNVPDMVAGNPNTTSPYRPQYQVIEPTVYVNDRIVQADSLISQNSVLTGSPVLNPSGPATTYNIKEAGA